MSTERSKRWPGEQETSPTEMAATYKEIEKKHNYFEDQGAKTFQDTQHERHGLLDGVNDARHSGYDSVDGRDCHHHDAVFHSLQRHFARVGNGGNRIADRRFHKCGCRAQIIHHCHEHAVAQPDMYMVREH